MMPRDLATPLSKTAYRSIRSIKKTAIFQSSLYGLAGVPLARGFGMLARPSDLARQVIGCAIEVHRVLGPGLLESIYEKCLAHELAAHQIRFRRQISLPVVYKNLRLDGLYRIDFVVEDVLLLELNSVEQVLPVHKAQALSHMRLMKVTQGIVINFNVAKLVDGLTNLLLPDRQ